MVDERGNLRWHSTHEQYINVTEAMALIKTIVLIQLQGRKGMDETCEKGLAHFCSVVMAHGGQARASVVAPIGVEPSQSVYKVGAAVPKENWTLWKKSTRRMINSAQVFKRSPRLWGIDID